MQKGHLKVVFSISISSRVEMNTESDSQSDQYLVRFTGRLSSVT